LPIEPAGPSSRTPPFVITEIMYKPFPSTNASGGSLEFVEIYNSNPFFEEISRFRLSGDIDYTFPSNSFVQGGQYIVVARDPAALQGYYNLSGVPVFGPYTNSLKGSSTVRLRNNSDGIALEVKYSNDPPWPVAADSTGHSLVLARPSYGEADPRAWAISDQVGGSPGRFDGYTALPQRNVLINEFLAHTEDPMLPDFIELYNHANQAVDISGCMLSDTKPTNHTFIIPQGTMIPARGFISFDETVMGFGLHAEGETVYLWNADATRVLDAVKFGAQHDGRSMGRYPDGASEFYPLQSRTAGANNSAIYVDDVVINEIMYKPISGLSDDEYVELYNKGANPVNLSQWQFTDGIEFTFPTNVTLAPDGYLVVAKNSARLLTNYPNLNTNNTLGNFKGTFSNRGEHLALSRPEAFISFDTNGMRLTNIHQVVVDEVTYGTGGNWGTWAAGGGSSLELMDPRSNHRLAHNWGDSDETLKAPWT